MQKVFNESSIYHDVCIVLCEMCWEWNMIFGSDQLSDVKTAVV